MTDPEKGPGGRPSPYEDEFADQAGKLCQLGATDMEIADFFGVSVRTIYRWKLEHERFCQALKVGKAFADDRIERALFQRAAGYDYVEQQAIKIKTEQYVEEVEVVDVQKHAPADTTAQIFWLKNRRPDQWREKQEVPDDPDNAPALQITIGVREAVGDVRVTKFEPVSGYIPDGAED